MMFDDQATVNTTGPARVAVLVDSLLAGGGERLAVEAACALDRDRFAPHVLVSRHGGPLEEVLVRAGVPFTVLGRRRGFSPARYLRAHRLVRGCDLLHAHKLGSNLWGALLARTTRVPFVAHEHTWSGVPSRRRMVGYRRWIAPVARRIVCVSDIVADSVVADGAQPQKVVVIPNGVRADAALPVEEARRELGLAAGALVVGIVARLRPEKAHDLLLRAAADLDDATVCVVGDGPCLPALRSLAAELGMGERVVWAGEREDAARLASAFDLAVICSDWEGLPLAALEALAAGVPLVATAVGALPELLDGDAGVLVPPGDRRALAAALAELAGDPLRRRALGTRGRERVREHYSFARMVASFERLYDDVLGRPPRP